MKSIRLCFCLLPAALCLAAAPALRAQTLLNGSFENPALAAGSIASGSGANWTTTGSAFVITNGYGNGTTPYGNQWEYLDASATDAQTVSGFTPGQAYFLTLSASAYANATTQLTLSLSGGTTASLSFTLPPRTDGITGTPLPFATYTLPFTPTSNAAVTFAFSDTGDSPLAMDNVQIVPEPGTWVMLGMGAAGMGIVTLHRRRTARTI